MSSENIISISTLDSTFVLLQHSDQLQNARMAFLQQERRLGSSRSGTSLFMDSIENVVSTGLDGTVKIWHEETCTDTLQNSFDGYVDAIRIETGQVVADYTCIKEIRRSFDSVWFLMQEVPAGKNMLPAALFFPKVQPHGYDFTHGDYSLARDKAGVVWIEKLRAIAAGMDGQGSRSIFDSASTWIKANRPWSSTSKSFQQVLRQLSLVQFHDKTSLAFLVATFFDKPTDQPQVIRALLSDQITTSTQDVPIFSRRLLARRLAEQIGIKIFFFSNWGKTWDVGHDDTVVCVGLLGLQQPISNWRRYYPMTIKGSPSIPRLTPPSRYTATLYPLYPPAVRRHHQRKPQKRDFCKPSIDDATKYLRHGCEVVLRKRIMESWNKIRSATNDKKDKARTRLQKALSSRPPTGYWLDAANAGKDVYHANSHLKNSDVQKVARDHSAHIWRDVFTRRFEQLWPADGVVDEVSVNAELEGLSVKPLEEVISENSAVKEGRVDLDRDTAQDSRSNRNTKGKNQRPKKNPGRGGGGRVGTSRSLARGAVLVEVLPILGKATVTSFDVFSVLPENITVNDNITPFLDVGHLSPLLMYALVDPIGFTKEHDKDKTYKAALEDLEHFGSKEFFQSMYAFMFSDIDDPKKHPLWSRLFRTVQIESGYQRPDVDTSGLSNTIHIAIGNFAKDAANMYSTRTMRTTSEWAIKVLIRQHLDLDLEEDYRQKVGSGDTTDSRRLGGTTSTTSSSWSDRRKNKKYLYKTVEEREEAAEELEHVTSDLQMAQISLTNARKDLDGARMHDDPETTRKQRLLALGTLAEAEKSVQKAQEKQAQATQWYKTVESRVGRVNNFVDMYNMLLEIGDTVLSHARIPSSDSLRIFCSIVRGQQPLPLTGSKKLDLI
ncbi:hypothetical protein BGZ74_000338 [Mortierella antarctica]|nr:hypothetical protein BGZ74_000338 [Mortierella antarctica]